MVGESREDEHGVSGEARRGDCRAKDCSATERLACDTDPEIVKACLDVLIAAEAWYDWLAAQRGPLDPHQRILFHAVAHRRAVEQLRRAGDSHTASGRLRPPNA